MSLINYEKAQALINFFKPNINNCKDEFELPDKENNYKVQLDFAPFCLLHFVKDEDLKNIINEVEEKYGSEEKWGKNWEEQSFYTNKLKNYSIEKLAEYLEIKKTSLKEVFYDICSHTDEYIDYEDYSYHNIDIGDTFKIFCNFNIDVGDTFKIFCNFVSDLSKLEKMINKNREFENLYFHLYVDQRCIKRVEDKIKNFITSFQTEKEVFNYLLQNDCLFLDKDCEILNKKIIIKNFNDSYYLFKQESHIIFRDYD